MTRKSVMQPRYYGKGSSDSPDPVDIYVGTRMKGRRNLMNLSQTELAAVLGITFQQVQKYERGTNRISASRLYQLGQVLDVPVSFFFEKFDEGKSKKLWNARESDQEGFVWIENNAIDVMEQKETFELVRTYYQIKDETVRKNFLKMLKALVASQT